jgi:hypothetical protein
VREEQEGVRGEGGSGLGLHRGWGWVGGGGEFGCRLKGMCKIVTFSKVKYNTA